MKDDRIYLNHILECIRRIEEDTREGEAAFFRSHTLQDAVLRNLQTMTESSRRLSQGIKATRPDVDWTRIAAFRNVLVHDYFSIDAAVVWRIVTRDVPPLKAAVEEMLRSLSP